MNPATLENPELALFHRLDSFKLQPHSDRPVGQWLLAVSGNNVFTTRCKYELCALLVGDGMTGNLQRIDQKLQAEQVNTDHHQKRVGHVSPGGTVARALNADCPPSVLLQADVRTFETRWSAARAEYEAAKAKWEAVQREYEKKVASRAFLYPFARRFDRLSHGMIWSVASSLARVSVAGQ